MQEIEDWLESHVRGPFLLMESAETGEEDTTIAFRAEDVFAFEVRTDEEGTCIYVVISTGNTVREYDVRCSLDLFLKALERSQTSDW